MNALQWDQLRTQPANCWLIWDYFTRLCAIVDPSGDGRDLHWQVISRGLKLQDIYLTHLHWDHIGAVDWLRRETHCTVWVHEGELENTEMSLGLMNLGRPVAIYEEGTDLILGKGLITVLHTPGHTPGSICLRNGIRLFTGDTLFAGSVGRTDLPGGDPVALRESLRRLGRIPGDRNIFPGHGPITSLDKERATNPYLKEALRR